MEPSRRADAFVHLSHPVGLPWALAEATGEDSPVGVEAAFIAHALDLEFGGPAEPRRLDPQVGDHGGLLPAVAETVSHEAVDQIVGSRGR
jgi:hypothetical protein